MSYATGCLKEGGHCPLFFISLKGQPKQNNHEKFCAFTLTRRIHQLRNNQKTNGKRHKNKNGRINHRNYSCE